MAMQIADQRSECDTRASARLHVDTENETFIQQWYDSCYVHGGGVD